VTLAEGADDPPKGPPLEGVFPPDCPNVNVVDELEVLAPKPPKDPTAGGGRLFSETSPDA